MKKKINWPMVLMVLGSLLLGGLCGMMIVDVALQQDLSFGPYMLTILALVLSIYVILFFHIALHEAGHLIFGLLTGYGFSSFRLGSFMLLRENGRLRLRRLTIPGTGGQCLMTPPEMVDGKIPYLLYNLGGCMVNLTVSLAALVLWVLLPRDTLWSVLLFMTAAFGLVLALSNGIPARVSGVDNDGRNALTLAKEPNTARAFWLQLKINEQLARGQRLKDMPDDWFMEPQTLNNSFDATAAVFSANRLMDSHCFQEAAAAMEKLLEKESALPELHRSMVTCDLLYCELIGQNRPEVRSRLLTRQQEKHMKALDKSIGVIRTRYVLALLGDREPDKAASLLDRFEKRIRSYPYPSEVQSERELIEHARQIYEMTSN